MNRAALVVLLAAIGAMSCDGEGITQQTGTEVQAAATVVDVPPLAELTDDQKARATQVVDASGFVDGQYTVAAWEPGYDDDGAIVSVVAIVVTDEQLSGTVVWPAYRGADDADGDVVLVGFDVTYELA